MYSLSMNRFIFFIVFFALLSCGKQSQKSKNNVDQQVAKQETPIIQIDLKRSDSISIDTELASKLSKKEISSIFTRRKENQVGISNTIYQAYSYKDKSGEYFLVLTDHMKGLNDEKDTLYDNIYAVNVTNKNNQFKKRSTIQDKIDEDWETSIGFWNRYSEISDFDNDGLVDLIVVYGTMGQDMHTDGRVRILTYHGKKRITIKHQNSDFGDGRVTQINSKFYLLPTPIQQKVKEKIRLMIRNGHAVFSQDWEKKMKKEAVRIEGE